MTLSCNYKLYYQKTSFELFPKNYEDMQKMYFKAGGILIPNIKLLILEMKLMVLNIDVLIINSKHNSW